MKRTLLPLNGLRVFDAAARHLSFTRAADELAVTPAAVGQQIRALEDLLGVILFRRTPKGLELTDEALMGLDALRSGFLQFEEAVRAIQAGQSSYRLTIAAPRDFTEKWLHAKLADFAKANPEIRYNLVDLDGDVDFTEANLDIAIMLAEGPGDHEGMVLAEGEFVCVCAPNFDAHDNQKNAQIVWPGCPREERSQKQEEEPYLQVGDAGLAIEMAAAGLGYASVPLLLAQQDLSAGRVIVHKAARPSRRSYWMVAPLPQWRQKKVKALVAALSAE
ncbi:LysR family transcriptional regulator [Parasphingorhabdus sp. DH2-15]|uniref:LysR family transcriptional regulator n=1 Tax=Parasphingorhabdus sp. DH2-15 TaxID=3444112 RepID=UPI003F68264D